jgi:hypothetical protein
VKRTPARRKRGRLEKAGARTRPWTRWPARSTRWPSRGDDRPRGDCNTESKEPGVAEIIIARPRDGPVGTTQPIFLRQWTKFDQLAPEHVNSEAWSARHRRARLA